MERRLIGVDELAEYLGVKKFTLYSWVSQGRIPSVKLGRLRKFDTRRIDQWIEANAVKENSFEIDKKF